MGRDFKEMGVGAQRITDLTGWLLNLFFGVDCDTLSG